MLYHPPSIRVMEDKMKDGNIYLNHQFEGKPLVREFIANTMVGIEYLWGGPVQLETSEIVSVDPPQASLPVPGLVKEERRETTIKWQRVLYTMKERKLTKQAL